MLLFINKYLRSRTNKDDSQPSGTKDKQQQHQHPVPAPGSDDVDNNHMCMSGCVPVPAKRGAVATATTTTARTSRHNFVRAAASGLLTGARFTDHESIPSLPDAYAEFAAAFPQYAALASADAVRDREYPHLHRHVCLDYTGINLFSHAQMEVDSSSSSSSSTSSWRPPFFDIAYKSTSLRTQVQQQQCGGDDVGAAITKRIMASLKIPDDEYTMVCTANRTTAFRLLAESYSFHSSGGSGKKQLLTVYDYESEAAGAMADTARRRGAHVASATFAWPSMRIHAADLRKKLQRRRGLFVFPLASRMTGARYPYLWMSAAQERGWHVALDACALGTKDLDTFGVSLLRPDFIVCNFFKVFGQNPSGFAGLFVRKSSLATLERSVIARSIGIVTIVPARRWSLRDRDDGYSTTTTELDRSRSFPKFDDRQATDGFDLVDDVDTSASFSGPLSSTAITRGRNLQTDDGDVSEEIVDAAVNARDVSDEIVEVVDAAVNARDVSEEIVEVVDLAVNARAELHEAAAIDDETERPVVECRGLDHADALGLIAIGNRLRCISNWLVVAMQKLRHPHAEDDGGHHLVRVYGPRVRFERAPSLAFNVFDWTGERVAPPLVQKLADRHNISLTCGFLRNIWFPSKHEADRAVVVLDRRSTPAEEDGGAPSGKRRKDDVGIFVVNASLGFLSNFEDAYRLWAFVAKFLDADFVEKERWRYTALNQRTVEV